LGDRLLQRTTVTTSNPKSLPSTDALVIGGGGRWFRPPNGERVGLERRLSLALLLDHLATSPKGSVFRANDLFAVAWPGQRAITSAAAHRVRVAIATLRKLGLREAIITTPDGGYGLSPTIEVVRA